MISHFRCKENYGDKIDQGRKHVQIEGHHTSVIIKENFIDWCLVFQKIIQPFRNVENDNNYRENGQRKNESSEIFLDDVPVQEFNHAAIIVELVGQPSYFSIRKTRLK